MSHFPLWPWAAMFLLGAYHGINPGMGWLFAVALGLQKKSAAAVWSALPPIAVGHFAAIAIVLAAALLAGAVVPLFYLKIGAACVLLGLGVYRLWRKSHPRFGGMQVGFRDLTIWSFLMASAHGAGFMLLPVLLKVYAAPSAGQPSRMHAAHLHSGEFGQPWPAVAALLIHTCGYLLVAGMVAFVVYRKVGLEILRKAWINLDLVWAIALIVTAALTLAIPG